MGRTTSRKVIKVDINGKMVDSIPCSKCGVLKPLTNFNKSKRGYLGLNSQCKDCYNEWYQKNKESVIKNSIRNYQKNKEKRNRQVTEYRRKNNDKVKIWNQKGFQNYYAKDENRRKRLKKHKEWKIENPEKAFKNMVQGRKFDKFLPYSLTEDEYVFLERRNCYFTNNKESEFDHFISSSTGHGGTYLGNLIKLSPSLNKNKRNLNPFEWIKVQDEYKNIIFNTIVNELAAFNDLTPQDFKRFVYWCYDNPRSIENLKKDKRNSLEIWKDDFYGDDKNNK